LGLNGLVFQVKCVVCSTIEKKDNSFPLKLDILQKHVGCCKIIVATADVVVSEWFYYKDASHNENKRIYTKRGNESILNLVQFDILASYKKTLIQFASRFHLLNQGRPVIEFVMLKDLYNLLRLKNNPKKIRLTRVGGEWQKVCMMLCWKTKKLLCKNLGFLL
jgi:hypothetical protein